MPGEGPGTKPSADDVRCGGYLPYAVGIDPVVIVVGAVASDPVAADDGHGPKVVTWASVDVVLPVGWGEPCGIGATE